MGFSSNNYDRHLINIVSKNPTDKKNDEDLFSRSYDKVIDEYIKSSGLENGLERNLLIPPHLRNAKLREEIKSEIEPVELMDYLKKAIQALTDDGPNLVESGDYEEMLVQLSKSSNYLKKINFNEEVTDDLKTLLHIDEHVMETIFKIAQLEYKNEKVEESLAIFSLLTVLVPQDPDYLYRLGIVARQINKLELALLAFAKATTLNTTFIEARIYSAECNLKLGNFQEAKNELDEIKNQANEKSIDQDWLDIVDQIEEKLTNNKK
ncbi:MAG: hypothetical protein H0T62_07460 [Parachlamydiaceae bacterium]|nr:hypothetical protein [Parachlamydiaceae bacterium]